MLLLRRIELLWAAYFNYFHLGVYWPIITPLLRPTSTHNISPCWQGPPLVKTISESWLKPHRWIVMQHAKPILNYDKLLYGINDKFVLCLGLILQKGNSAKYSALYPCTGLFKYNIIVEPVLGDPWFGRPLVLGDHNPRHGSFLTIKYLT